MSEQQIMAIIENIVCGVCPVKNMAGCLSHVTRCKALYRQQAEAINSLLVKSTDKLQSDKSELLAMLIEVRDDVDDTYQDELAHGMINSAKYSKSSLDRLDAIIERMQT